MKILFVTPQVPWPPAKGTTIRNAQLIRLAAERHEVRVLSILAPGDELSADLGVPIEGVPAPARSTVDRVAGLVWSDLPDLAARLASTEAAATYDRLIATFQPDIVQVEAVEAAGAIGLHDRLGGPPIVYDAHNAEYALQESIAREERGRPVRVAAALYSRMQAARLRTYEGALVRRSAAVLAVSAGDGRALATLGGPAPVVVPNAIDTGHYDRSDRQPDPTPLLLFVGTLDYRPNVLAVRWFAMRVLPRLRREFRGLRLAVVGQRPAPAITQLASPAVWVVGSVEDDRPWLDRAAVCIVPLRSGGGMRFKVVQAMAAGVPVVSTSFGAEGVETEGSVAIADSADAFADAIRLTLRQPAETADRVEQARAIVRERYDWRSLRPIVHSIYDRLGSLVAA